MLSLKKVRLLTGILSILFINNDAVAQMRSVFLDTTMPVDQIYKIDFFNAAEGYLAFHQSVGYTSDSGRHITKRFITGSNVDYNGYAVNLLFGFFANGVKAFGRDTLLVYGDYGLVPAILYSTNGGNSYKLVYHSQYDPFNLRTGITDMSFPGNGNIGYAADADRVLKTTDRGRSWFTSLAVPASYYSGISAPDNSHVYVYNPGNNLIKSTNGSWQSMLFPGPAGTDIFSLYFLTADTGWLCASDNGSSGYIYKTVNGGGSWVLQNNIQAAPFRCNKMIFANSNTGYALSGLTVFKTINSGAVWEPLPRDNDYAYLNYGHNDLHYYPNGQIWAGGGHGFLELATGGGGNTIPVSLFLIDTSGAGTQVQLQNFSLPSYQYKWYVNGAYISAAYDASYNHDIYRSRDTVTLVVSNGTDSASVTKIQLFNAAPPAPYPVVNSFIPDTGYTGSMVTIRGINFTGTTAVSFGGTAATSFIIDSPTVIRAFVGEGASGAVQVTNAVGTSTKGGFVYTTRLKIISFSPASGPAGTIITLHGTNFSNNPAANIVYAGGVRAAVLTADNSTLTIRIPPGTAQQPITVTTGGLTAASNLPFSITYSGSCGITAAAFTDTVQSFTSMDAAQMIPADLDGDGRLDIIYCDESGRLDKLGILRNTSIRGSLSFAPFQLVQVNPGNTSRGSFYAADMNGDGKIDLVVPDGVAMSVILNTSVPGQVSFAPKQYFSNFTNTVPFDIHVEDLDGDGLPDIFGLNSLAVVVYKNTSSNGVLSFPLAPSSFMIGTGGGDIINCRAADIDGDGKKDIIASSNFYSHYVSNVLLNKTVNGDISFAVPPIAIEFSNIVGGSPFIELADFNNDGKIDIGMLKNTQLCFAKNQSSPGSVAFPQKGYLNLPDQVWRFACNDLDGDAKAELVLSYIYNKAIDIFTNTSTTDTISFAGPLSRAPEAVPYNKYSCIADFDLDGRNDIATFNLHLNLNTFDTRPVISVFRNSMCKEGAVDFCTGGTVTMNANFSGTSYQWHQNSGTGFADIANNANVTGATTASIRLTGIPSSWYGYRYRCEVNGNSYSNEYTLKTTNFWTGRVNNNWSNAGNWSCGVVPDGTTDVLINSGTVLLDMNGLCRTINIMPGVLFTVQPTFNLTVTH